LLVADRDSGADTGGAWLDWHGIDWLGLGRWRCESLSNWLSWVGCRLDWNEAEEVGWAALTWNTSSWGSTVDKSVGRHFAGVEFV